VTISAGAMASKKARSVNSAVSVQAKSRLMTIFLFFASLAAGSATLTAPIDDQERTARVRFADLDLSTAAGRATLDRRIESAVKRVCAPAGPTRPTDLELIGACREQALKDASRQIQFAAGASADAAELWASR
jgi:UrcA family protein